MIKFRCRKIDNNFYKIHMVKIVNNETNVFNIPVNIPVPGKPFCITHSNKIAKKVCRLLESVTKCQDLKNWNRSTLKRVQQIVRLINRIHFYKHTYPITFEKLEAILGWNLAAWAVSETYKKQIASYKLRYDEMKKYSYGYWENDIFVNTDPKKHLLEDITSWIQDPDGYIFDPKKGEYQKNPYSSQNNHPLF